MCDSNGGGTDLDRDSGGGGEEATFSFCEEYRAEASPQNRAPAARTACWLALLPLLLPLLLLPLLLLLLLLRLPAVGFPAPLGSCCTVGAAAGENALPAPQRLR